MATPARYVARGLQAGLVAGIAFGAFVAWVGNPLVAYAETFEHSHGGGGSVVPGTATALLSVVGGALLGLLLGAVVFGVLYYFLEPAIPGTSETKSYVLGAAGFVTVSGAPWLVFPPQPPGVDQVLSTETRIVWYALMMGAGALACGLSGYAYTRLRGRYGRSSAFVGALVVLGVLPVVATLGPANPVSGSVPTEFVFVYQTITGVGQLGLWFVLASAHEWFRRRDRADDSAGEEWAVSTDAPGSVLSDP